MKSQLVCSTIDFKVIERTNLSSLSEGMSLPHAHDIMVCFLLVCGSFKSASGYDWASFCGQVIE